MHWKHSSKREGQRVRSVFSELTNETREEENMATEVLMPRQGQSVESCIINDWRVSEGDAVTEGDIVCDIETDKATFEVESPVSGTVLALFYPVDADVEVLKTIAVIGDVGENISALSPVDEATDTVSDMAASDLGKSASEPMAGENTTKAGVHSFPAQTSSSHGFAGISPRAKKVAAEKGVNISTLLGSGPEGRIIERDVLAAQKAIVSPAAQVKASREGLQIPERGSGIGGRVLSSDLVTGLPDSRAADSNVPSATPGTYKQVPVKGVRKIIAERMYASLQNSAQLTHHTSVDARAIMACRKQCKSAPEDDGINNISINDMVLYATVKTLMEYPELNAHFSGDNIIQFDNVHLGLAVDTPRGLVVPVIRYANKMDLITLSSEAKRLAASAVEGNINPDNLTGGTFTVSNLGAMGIEAFTPVLNAPEVGILGVCNIQLKPVMGTLEIDTEPDVQFIPHMGLSLTFDHCAIDGAPTARFLSKLKETLAAFELTYSG